MKNTLYSIVILAVMISFFACSEDRDDVIADGNKTKSVEKLMKSDSFNEKGILHNDKLRFLLEHLPANTNAENIRQHTEQVIKEYEYLEGGYGDMYIFSDYRNPSNMLQELADRNLISIVLYDLVQKDFKDLSNFDNYGTIDNFIASRLESMPELNITDKNCYMDYLSVLKHSFMFWNPKGENGASYFTGSRQKYIDIFMIIDSLINIAKADSVTNLIPIGGVEIPYTQFDYHQSSFFHFENNF
ncbi:hypothetical protein [Aquimarina sediminis]|uniref:hypothetical protein n=1 Tax=Aquimarina sediminis TaxID=2070536 RepID=UPI000CA04C10|nr:hypothetical protein [Aquimarina sediminis]